MMLYILISLLKVINQKPLEKNYQFYPLTNNLEIKLYENEETDTRHGFFRIPMSKLYPLPKKNHLINVRCVWVEKADGKVTE
jgi:hypothetical protein